jgi:hypothetical protein
MPVLRIVVLQPPADFGEYRDLELVMQNKAGSSGPRRLEDGSLEFVACFEMKTDRSGVLEAVGPEIVRQGDGQRFIYLQWWGVRGGSRETFRRIKVFLDQVPGFPGAGEDLEVRVLGVDKRGTPACARAVTV